MKTNLNHQKPVDAARAVSRDLAATAAGYDMKSYQKTSDFAKRVAIGSGRDGTRSQTNSVGKDK